MQRRAFLLTPAAAAQSVSPSSRAAARPCLYFSAADVARIRARIAKDAAFGRKWQALLESAGRMLGAPFTPEAEALRGGGQHANYGQPGGQISALGPALGLAWHVTGERRYAEKLRDALLYYAAYQRWNGPGKEGRIPQWKSELGGARFCFGFAAGYDALHSFLSPAERKSVAEAMVKLGILPVLEDWILPETRIHALDSMGHNWWSVCVSMAGVAALALLGDDARAPEWVDRVSGGLAQWFGYRGNVLQNKAANFDRGGAFYEGIGYANYALSEYLRFRLAHANVLPDRRQSRFKALDQAADFFLQTLYPTNGSFFTLNFGDSGLHNDCSPSMRLLVETGFPHPCAGWYIERVAFTASTAKRRMADPFELLARKSPPAVHPKKLPLSAIYRDIGWAVMRSSWEDDATLLAVRSGFTWNHVHADANSFVLFHAGAPLLTDSGACSYASPLYGRYYVQSRAHNVILFNGEGQPSEDIRRGVKFPGAVRGLLDGAGVRYVYGDAAGPTSRWFSRNFRHWLWIGGAILVFDDLLAHQEGRLDWLLHYDGTATRDGGAVTISNSNARASVRFLHPSGMTSREEMGYADRRPERQVPYLVFSPQSTAREQKIVTAILPEGGGSVTVEPLSANLALGVRVIHGDEATDVWLNLQSDGRRMHDNSNHTIEGWDTDAYLLALTRPRGSAPAPGNVSRYFVACASYLRHGGSVLLDSLSKLDAAWRPGVRAEIHCNGQDEAEAAIGVASRPERLLVNGREREFRYDRRSRLVSFRMTAG